MLLIYYVNTFLFISKMKNVYRFIILKYYNGPKAITSVTMTTIDYQMTNHLYINSDSTIFFFI